MDEYKCPICGNTNINSIGYRNGKPNCRKCITFKGQEASVNYIQNDSGEYTLHYELLDDQKRLSKQLVENYKKEFIPWFMQYVDPQRHEIHNIERRKHEQEKDL